MKRVCFTCGRPTKTVQMIYNSFELCRECENQKWAKRGTPVGWYFFDEDTNEYCWELGKACLEEGCPCKEELIYNGMDENETYVCILYVRDFDAAPGIVTHSDLISLGGYYFQVCNKYIKNIYYRYK